MRCKVGFLTRRPSGGVARRDQRIEVPGDRVRLGRGTDNEIYLSDLRVGYHAASLLLREDHIVLEAAEDATVTIDGAETGRGIIALDSEILVGPYALRLLPPGADADLALEIELAVPAAEESVDTLLPRSRRVARPILGRRLMSWVAFAAALALCLILPLLAHLTPKPAVGETDAPPAQPLATFDRYWVSGTLSASHKFMSERCDYCHQDAFVQVAAPVCVACHAQTQHHFDTVRFDYASFDPNDCMGCHREHEGPLGIVPTRQSLCVGCHTDLAAEPFDPPSELLEVRDFGSDHPQFRPGVLVDPAAGTIERASLGAPDFPEERSNLRFPHDVHLNKHVGAYVNLELGAGPTPGQQELEPRLLVCGDCHRPEPGGMAMLPITMNENCASCHRLNFDVEAPTRVLPHGQPDEVIAVLHDYFAARAIDAGAVQAGGAPAPVVAPNLRRRPGTAAGTVTRSEQPAPTAVVDVRSEAEADANQRLDMIFGTTLCGVCHVTTPPAESAQGKWEVEPSRLVPLWMPKAQFDHAAHSTTPCQSCHAAMTSRVATDVLMPGIEGCRACHAGEASATKIPSPCLMCHVYHRDGLPALAETVEMTALPR